jgi:isoquinoline 1-oxidoreductase alpha subunit
MPTYRFRVDGRSVAVHSDGDTPLLHALRGTHGVNGPRSGCGPSPCGACTVHLDGEPVRSCTMPISAVAGRSVSTHRSRAEQPT